MIVALGSVRGSPGVTSWSMLLAAAWPTEYDVDRVVLEADVDGGVLGARYGFGVEPGTVSLMAAIRGVDGGVAVGEHGRLVGERTWVVPGPESAEHSRSVWSHASEAVAARLAADERLWLVDCGRLNAATPAQAFVDRARLTLVLSRPEHESLVQLPRRLTALGKRCANVGVLVTGKCGYPVDELRSFLATEHVWTVGADDDLVQVAGAVHTPGRARRAWLWRTAVEIATSAAAIAHAQPASRGPAVEERTLEPQRSVR